MTTKLYKFHWDCGRLGSVEGMFLADEKEVEDAIGKHIYFGEILGKHSEISGELERDDLEVIDLTPEVEQFFKDHFEGWSISGFNPLDYLPEE